MNDNSKQSDMLTRLKRLEPMTDSGKGGGGRDGRNKKDDKKDDKKDEKKDNKKDEKKDDNKKRKVEHNPADDDLKKKKRTIRNIGNDDLFDDDDDAATQIMNTFFPIMFDSGGCHNKKISKQSLLQKRINESGLSGKDKEYVLNRLKNVDVDKEKATEWFEGLLRVPFGKFAENPVNSTTPQEELNKYFDKVSENLNNAVHGMDKVKEDIVNYIAQFISTNNKGSPRVLGLCGSAGIGKTVIIRKGLANVLARPMRTISMGGIRDSSHFMGFDYSYSGSRYGAIAQCLIEAEVMNPIIFMDELDKISSTHDGVDIQNVLVHLTDPIQNMNFQDKYFSGVNIDLSKVIFVFAFNDIELLSPILRDRITVIHVPDPDMESKIIIGTKYLVKEICPNVGLKDTDVVFSESIIKFIIKNHCKHDKGVRGLKKCMETIVLKINTARFLGSKSKREFHGAL